MEHELLGLLERLAAVPTKGIVYRKNEVGIQVWVTDSTGKKHAYFVDVDGNGVNLMIDFLIAVCEAVGMFFFLFPAFRTTDRALAGWSARYSRIDIPASWPVGGEYLTQREASTAASLAAIKHYLLDIPQ